MGNNNASLSTALERLSTGSRINRGKDDPSGLIASENLRAEQRGLNHAVINAERADQVVGTAETGLQEVASLLTELQGLVVSAANTAGRSKEERAAGQLSVDSILQTIDRLSTSTTSAQQGGLFLSTGPELTRSQIPVQASTNILSLANNAPQSALSLLGSSEMASQQGQPPETTSRKNARARWLVRFSLV